MSSKGRLPGTVEGKPLEPGHPQYDAVKARELERLVAVIDREEKKAAHALWDQGRAYSRIKARRLYLQAGYSSMSAWVAGTRLISVRWVDELIWFADTFREDQVELFGRPRLLLAAEYIDLTRTDESVWAYEAIDELPIAIPNGRGVETKVFAEVTEPELKAAVAHQQSLKQKRDGDALPAEQSAFVAMLDEEVAKLASATGHTAKVQARPSADRDPAKTTVAIELPYAELAKLLRKLAKLV